MTWQQYSERRKAFKHLLEQPGCIMVPGAFNAAVAKLIEQLGFSAAYITGAGLHNGVKGVPDVGLLSLAEMTQFAGYIAQAVKIPVISDADTGFDDVGACVQAFEDAGLTGIHLEDQTSDKRCGHLDGKQVIAIDEMQQKIKAACQARRDPNFLIIARVDSRSINGFQDALIRAKAYEAAGADMIFAEALQSKDEFAHFCAEVNAPILANMTEFGKTPYLNFEEFKAAGCKVVIYPMTTFRLAMKAIEQGLLDIKTHGTQEQLLDVMQTRKELYALLDYTP